MKATVTAYMPGDILFYGKLAGSLTDEIISDWTNSNFVHVAIAVSASLKVEALYNGIVKTPIDSNSVAKAYYYHQRADVNAKNLAYALLWLDGMVGQVYGWGDIANAFLTRFEHGATIVLGDHFDCSALACEFLIKAGGVPGLQVVTDPHKVTPAMLAAYLGVK
jgi:hypothetical protein